MINHETSKAKPTCSTPVLRISWKVLEAVASTIGSRPAESGGAVGGVEDGEEVTRFHFDDTAHRTSVTYSPDHGLLNRLFKEDWNPRQIRLRGFIHSHPGGSSTPSGGDEVYAEKILLAIPDLPGLWLPIINTVPDSGHFRFTPWFAELEEGRVVIRRGQVVVVGLPRKSKPVLFGTEVCSLLGSGNPLDEISIPVADGNKKNKCAANRFPKFSRTKLNGARQVKNGALKIASMLTRFACPPVETDNTFQRVEKAYDLPLMGRSRIIAVGAGGAAEWLEQLARAGMGQFVLIDPDTVSETNLATQQTYRRDIGRPKVECIAERILDINPKVKIQVLQKSLDDLDDAEMAMLVNGQIGGKKATRTVIAGLTDNFFAQARVNRLALQFGIPSLCAQVYKEGRGAEVTYTFPGVTPACHRCVLSSRYKYFLEEKMENDVTSHGTPIFATSRLNAIKGLIALALFHHGSSHPRWGSMLKRLGKRNLAVVRMDPDLADSIGMGTFDRVFEKADTDRLFCDETLWLPQDHESPATGYAHCCPDCGGTGDLRDAIGTIHNTVLRRAQQNTTSPAKTAARTPINSGANSQ